MTTNLSSEAAPGEPAATVPFRMVLFSMVVLWATYFVLTTVRSVVMDIGLQFEFGWRRLVVTVIGILLTLVLWSLLRLFDNRQLWLKISAAIALALPVAMAIGQVNYWVFRDMSPAVDQAYAQKMNLNLRRDESGNLLVEVPVRGDGGADGSTQSVIIEPAETPSDFWRKLLDVALGRYFLLLAWASTYFALLAGVQARAAQRREEQFRSAAKAAELRSLRYQVNPHFLFNTLNSISTLVLLKQTEPANAMLTRLSGFLRHTLIAEPGSQVTLAQEIETLQLYLDIERMRFEERLRTHFEIEDAALQAQLPAMLLQPLVENAIKYAVSPQEEGAQISLTARVIGERLRLTVEDTGPGVDDSPRDPSAPPVPGRPVSTGVGLANIRNRLAQAYGDNHLFETRSEAGGGFTVLIEIPFTPAIRAEGRAAPAAAVGTAISGGGDNIIPLNPPKTIGTTA